MQQPAQLFSETFLLASSPFATPRLVALAYIAGGPVTAPETGTAIALSRSQVWRIIVDLERSRLVEPAGRQRWRITGRGVAELQRFAAILAAAIRASA